MSLTLPSSEEVDPVEDVEHLGAELQLHRLAEPDVLVERRVDPEEARAVADVAAGSRRWCRSGSPLRVNAAGLSHCVSVRAARARQATPGTRFGPLVAVVTRAGRLPFPDSPGTPPRKTVIG